MNVIVHTNTGDPCLFSKQMLDGIEHLVVPAILLKESVLNNVFYSKEEIANHFQTWDGVPISVGHPKVVNTPVSANSPAFHEKVNIGTLFNSKVEDGDLKGEIWINLDKAKRLGFMEIEKHFMENKMMEVSTGLFADFRKEKGSFNDKDYLFEAFNIRPDHIALLPDDIGACSIADGCGALRVMEKDFNVKLNEVKNMKDEIVQSLVVNCQTQFTEEDKETLSSLEEGFLKKLIPIVNDTQTKELESLKLQINEMQKNALSQEQYDYFMCLKANEDERINKIRQNVLEHYEYLTEESAKNIEPKTLEALEKSIKKPTNNEARAGSAAIPEVRSRPKYFVKKSEVNNG